ncbi:MAG: hypothetical protein WD850_02610 [Candidatus Spechtbacterales bacterium]
MQEIEYQGYRITAEAYQDPGTGKWVPRAFLHADEEGDPLTQDANQPLTWMNTFGTQEEAEDYALESAQLRIAQAGMGLGG